MEQNLSGAPAMTQPRAVASSSRFLRLVVFLAGVGTLGIEMVASRLLAPFFGTSQPIWAVVIGLTLIYLAIGYRIGGRLADRRPDERLFYRIIAWAGMLTALIPLISDPILRFAQQSLGQLAVAGFLGALFGVLILFAAPVTLMAMVTPFALRLEVERTKESRTKNQEPGTELADIGATAGSLSAISTVGSIVGTFLTVLYLIPAIGTARTIYLFAAFLVVLGLIGLRDWRYLLMLLAVAGLAFYTLTARENIKTAGCRNCELIHEEESAYNYIQVARRDTVNGPTINLILNEGLAIHSLYPLRYGESGDPADLLSGGGPWDYFNVTPFFYPNRSESSVRSMAMLGSATGTVPGQFLAVYGPDRTVDAVEIDPRIVEVGREYFRMRDNTVSQEFPNYRVYAQDARFWLETSAGSYDIIGMDAYHQPYIPFHLTTVEFFRAAKAHLTPQGVVAVNAGKGTNGDDRLGRVIAHTMLQVFPQVFVIETAGFGNQIIVGVNQPVGDGVRNFTNNIADLQSPVLRGVMGWALSQGQGPLREIKLEEVQSEPIFTDDKAPVEQLIDSLIFNTALGE
ncbi:MAG: fused MFS/spermidine synthase [Roseiflexaceae bacterium]